MIHDPIAVCSRSFSKNKVLRAELLSQYSNVKFNDEGLLLSGDSLIDFLAGHKRAIIALEKVDEYVLSKLPELEIISKYGVGLDMIDMKAMRLYKKRLGWEGGVNKRSVAELALGFAINLLRHIDISNHDMRNGDWRQYPGGQLTGKTVGIIGCGHVGKDLVKLLQPFECRILTYDIISYDNFYAEYNIIPTTLSYLLQQADIVTLHVPLNNSTHNIITKAELSLMKKESILINTARGGIVDEEALKKSLLTGQIAGAGFDVFSIEPPLDTELLNLPNFLSTPHIGGSSTEAILAMGRAAINGLSVNVYVE